MTTANPFPSRPPTAPASALDRSDSDVVLIVDDVPDNLAVLHDALDESGYTVLVATGGEAALARAAQALPDIVLLDAMMPGMDGFEVAKRLKAQPATAHIPIIFMTGLTETEYLVAALEAGGVDYVTKPIKPKEVLARMNVHMQGARQARQTRNALDAFGYASITVRASDGRLMWQTPLARELLHQYYGEPAPGAGGLAPQPVADWLRRHLREAEVLYWVVKGKINRDIADIVGASPATVKKHLERVFAKLGVETRTAAAGMAMTRMRQLHPHFEG